MNSPCHNCPDRTITCHGACSRYRQWKAENDERLMRIAKEKEKRPEWGRKTIRHIWKEMKWK